MRRIGFVLIAFLLSCSAKPAHQAIQLTPPAQFLADKESYSAAIVKVKAAEDRWLIEEGDHIPFLRVQCEMEDMLSGKASWQKGESQLVGQLSYTNMTFEPIAPPAIEGRRYLLWMQSTTQNEELHSLGSWFADTQGFLLIRGSGESEFVFWNGKCYSVKSIRALLKGNTRLSLDQIVDPVQRIHVAEKRIKDGNVGDEKAFIEGLMINVNDSAAQWQKAEQLPRDAASTDTFGMAAGERSAHYIWFESLVLLRELGKQESHRKAVVTALTPVARNARSRIRLVAALSLAQLGSDAGRDALVRGYEVESGNVSSDPPHTMTFGGGFDFGDSSVMACAYALACLGDYRGLHHAKTEVRLAAAEAVKDAGVPELEPSLRQLLPAFDADVEKLRAGGELSKPRDRGDYTRRYPENWLRAHSLLARLGDESSLRLLVEAWLVDMSTYPKEAQPLLPTSRAFTSSGGASIFDEIVSADRNREQLMKRIQMLYEKDKRWNEPGMKSLRASLEVRDQEDVQQPEPVPDEAAIVKQLTDPDPDKRAEALAASGYHKMEKFYDRLLEAALTRKGNERAAAIYGLGWYEHEVPETSMRKILACDDLATRWSALELATRRKPARYSHEAMQIFHEVVKSKGVDSPWAADDNSRMMQRAEVLCRLARGPLPPHLLAALKDPDPVVRRTVVLALQLSGNPDVIPYLQPLIHDADPKTIEFASAALKRLGPGL